MGIAAPHREAQVVADQRTDPPALEFELHLALARGVVIVLTRHAEQMALVIMPDLAIRTRPQQAVAVATVSGMHDHAAGDHRIELFRLVAQPVGGRALFPLPTQPGSGTPWRSRW